jgi:hypothetical protein
MVKGLKVEKMQRRSLAGKGRTHVKIFFLFALIAPMTWSCLKETRTEETAPRPKMNVTIEVTSADDAMVSIPAIGSQPFEGLYKRSFVPTGNIVAVNLHSDMPCKKTIKIYVNNELVAQRGGSCDVTDYDLTYDLNQF